MNGGRSLRAFAEAVHLWIDGERNGLAQPIIKLIGVLLDWLRAGSTCAA